MKISSLIGDILQTIRRIGNPIHHIGNHLENYIMTSRNIEDTVGMMIAIHNMVHHPIRRIWVMGTTISKE